MFTSTEAGAVAVTYALFVELVIYRQMTLKKLNDCLLSAALLSAAPFSLSSFYCS
ncbi:MAG: TRAP transporter large permease subunit [Pseudomonadota bacterium]|nr:TRAP transporter large permease subunit [Pseudomonadota bacterium]